MIEYSDEDKTPWFLGTVAPVRDGVYERKYLDEPKADESQRFAKFVHGRWYIGHSTPAYAEEELSTSLYRHGNSDFRWRGLASDPNAVTITPEVHVVAHNVPGLALDSGEFIPATELNKVQVDDQYARYSDQSRQHAIYTSTLNQHLTQLRNAQPATPDEEEDLF